MDKNNFLEELREELYEREVSGKAIDEIVEDYDSMITEANESGDFDIISRLGKPSQAASKLARLESKENGVKHKLIATSPFISLILFFVLGMQFDLWHPGWLVFMLVPITGVLLGSRMNLKTQIVGLSPFITFLLFFVYGYNTGIWHPTWLIFFIIPVLGLMFEESGIKRYGGVALFTVIPLLYLYLELNYNYEYSWLLFGVILVAGYFMGFVKIVVSTDKALERKLTGLIVLLAVIYIAFGVLLNWWHPAWIIFLVVPVYAMKSVDEHVPLVGYSPFIATLAFVVIGELFNAYAWSWLVFLIIPLIGIFTEGDSKSSIDIRLNGDPKLSIEITKDGEDEEDML